MSAEAYFKHYESNGFFFSNSVLTKYCISLYTKPFVLLSGISGTGKTKIAQLFRTFEDEVREEVGSNPEVSPNLGDGYIILRVTKGIVEGDGRGNLNFSDLAAVFEPDDIPVIEQRIADFRERGVNDNITDHEKFIIEVNGAEISISIYLQRASSPLLRVRFISRASERPGWNSQEYMRQHFQVGDVMKLVKVGVRRFRLVEVNERSIIEASTSFEAKEERNVGNKLFVPVRSNWNDNSELVGYYNVLQEKYQLTPFLKFLMRAHEFPNKPFFVIFDEMNLSRVEHYFSDFLSCLESRVVIDGVLHQEKVPLHNMSTFADSDDDYFDAVPSSIEVPKNLYVTGTVNIDETTFTFSPKVLDRANVIEFNEVDLNSYQPGDEQGPFVLREFPTFGSAGVINSADFRKGPERFKQVAQDLIDILQPYNLHFGYRVLNEMAAFLNNSARFIGKDDAVIVAAIDIQISQKILPKLNGAFGKLDEPLRKLINYFLGRKAIDYTLIDVGFVNGILAQDTNFPESLSKLIRMYKSLVFNGFASFME